MIYTEEHNLKNLTSRQGGLIFIILLTYLLTYSMEQSPS